MSSSDLVVENDKLRLQVAELVGIERALREVEEEQRRQAEDLRISKQLVDNALDGITLTSMTGKIVYANPAFKAMSGFGNRAIGSMLADFYSPEHFDHVSKEVVPTLIVQGHWRGLLHIRRPDGSEWIGQTSAFLLADSTGAPTGMAAIFRDITAQVRAEQERLAYVQVIEAQRAALRELSTPLIPIAEGVIAMPLIGEIDSERAQQILESLLAEIEAERAKVAILDITGVRVVDTHVAATLVRVAQAAKLLGAEVVLTGVGPSIALSLVNLGAELHGIITCGAFQRGIAYALGRTRRKDGPR
jgi:rsbT co-antagonist protein RsbR